MNDICMIYITTADKTEAELIAGVLLEKKLVACVNIINNILSLYTWEGKQHKDKEALLIGKTRQDLLPELEKKVKETHSYDCPCITAYPAIHVSEDFSRWVKDNTVRSRDNSS